MPITATGLATLAASLGRPIYWAGAEPRTTYELTRLGDGRVYVRYLPAGTKIGSAQPALTVASYPDATATADVERSASQPGSVRLTVPGNEVAFYNKNRPTNVYLAFPGGRYQVEVFDPDAGQAHRLVTEGKIVPVQPAGTGARIVSAAQLTAYARSVKNPIYWAGPRNSAEYELTTTVENRVYVRYLPAGAKAGTKAAALTVASYPTADAFARLKAIASGGGSVQVPVTGGGIAFFTHFAPSSVYLAYPGSNVQIEVFDPTPGRARQLVTAGKIEPVR